MLVRVRTEGIGKINSKSQATSHPVSACPFYLIASINTCPSIQDEMRSLATSLRSLFLFNNDGDPLREAWPILLLAFVLLASPRLLQSCESATELVDSSLLIRSSICRSHCKSRSCSTPADCVDRTCPLLKLPFEGSFQRGTMIVVTDSSLLCLLC